MVSRLAWINVLEPSHRSYMRTAYKEEDTTLNRISDTKHTMNSLSHTYIYKFDTTLLTYFIIVGTTVCHTTRARAPTFIIILNLINQMYDRSVRNTTTKNSLKNETVKSQHVHNIKSNTKKRASNCWKYVYYIEKNRTEQHRTEQNRTEIQNTTAAAATGDADTRINYDFVQ